MARQLHIIGLGEALLVEHPDHTEASGLAACIAIEAVRLGNHGLVVSRIGQDTQAEILLEALRSAGVDTSHVQQDPDLATGRVVVRPTGVPVARYLESPAAFDNLQSDFDLEDVAQQADAVVFGVLTRRGGQTRSEENRFLEACAAAVKLFDLTNRGRETPDRRHLLAGLEMADAALLDAEAIAMIRPASPAAAERETMLELLRDARLTFALTVDETAAPDDQVRLTLHAADRVEAVSIPATPRARAAACVVLLDAMLRGRETAPAMKLAARVAEHAVTHGDEPVPPEWMEG